MRAAQLLFGCCAKRRSTRAWLIYQVIRTIYQQRTWLSASDTQVRISNVAIPFLGVSAAL